MPIERNSIFFRIFLEVFLQLVVERSDRCAFAGDLRGHALGDLAGGAVVHQDVEFGLALNVDESRRRHKTSGIDSPLGNCVVQITDLGDAVAKNPNISVCPGGTGAINDAGSADYKIVIALLPFAPCGRT